MACDLPALHTLLAEKLKAYPTVKESILVLIDGMSADYKAFHLAMVKAHTGMLRIKQNGKTYHVNRVSNIRGTTGYYKYTVELWHEAPLEYNDVNIVYTLFMDKWLEPVTIKLDI